MLVGHQVLLIMIEDRSSLLNNVIDIGFTLSASIWVQGVLQIGEAWPDPFARYLLNVKGMRPGGPHAHLSLLVRLHA